MTVEVITTVVISGVTKTFTATAETSGNPGRAARALIQSVGGDVADWTYEFAKETRR